MELIEGLKVIKEYCSGKDCFYCDLNTQKGNTELYDNLIIADYCIMRTIPCAYDFRRIKPAVKKITTPEA